MKKVTVPDILKMKVEGRKISVLTAYDYPMSMTLDNAGLPVMLVGDSVGMVHSGYETTLPVTLEEMIYHTRAVVRGRKNALVITDMPFASYQTSISDARRSAARLMKEGGAEAVKLEGGVRCARVIRAIVDMDIPVMGHIGLTPQSVHAFGGYKMQGKGTAGQRIMDDARAVEDAGAFAVVLESIPPQLAKEITESLSIPTIGIGAGPWCDGQVLVINDMLGMENGIRTPKFVRKYADLKKTISDAAARYIEDVETGVYPDKEGA